MNKQISLQASDISSSLLEVLGKGAAGTTVCCSLLPGISHYHSHVISHHTGCSDPTGSNICQSEQCLCWFPGILGLLQENAE